MHATPAFRSGWTIARSMWLARQPAFVGLVAAPLLCGWFFHLAPASFLSREGAGTLGKLLMGLSLFLTFTCCNFTENDRRERLDGFPARLFTLPVGTSTLVAAPLLFSALVIAGIYAGWARLALPATGESLPLAWPLLYLTTGMLCYQTMVWTLARWRMLRLLVLGIGGTLLAVGWLFWLPEAQLDFLPTLVGANLPLQTIMCACLVAVSIGAWGMARVAVARQRRGEQVRWKDLLTFGRRKGTDSVHPERTLWERLADALPRARRGFGSPAQAQFWFEWRRHGSLLPLSTAAVLLLLMAPAPFFAPLTAEITAITLCWIVVLPLLLAYVLGKGFGKADLWSKEPGLSLFQATRPLSGSDRLGAKLKAATVATISTWGVLLPATMLWLWLWCDWPPLWQELRQAAAESPNQFSIASALMLLAIVILCTWRFLVGSLYLGLSGKRWMINLAGCGVFLTIFAPLVAAAPALQAHLQEFLFPRPWIRWLLLGVFSAKVLTAAGLTLHARRRAFVTDRAIVSYLVIWLILTAIMIFMVRHLVPLEFIAVGWNKRLFTILALFFVPMLRIAYAPIALAGSRHS